jgi:formylglycine-generating enzyme required for sulfatase activity
MSRSVLGMLVMVGLVLMAGLHGGAVHSSEKGKELSAAPAPLPMKAKAGIEMVSVPAGTFQMGSPEGELGRYANEKPHEVKLSKGFLIGKTEVTQGQWKAVMGEKNNPSVFKKCGDDCPVEHVSWFEAAEFCNKLSQQEGLSRCYSGNAKDGYRWEKGCAGYRLPTEAEWEYAARAGSAGAFSSGGIAKTECEAEPSLTETGWYCGSTGAGKAALGTHKAAQLKPNAFGLFDMNGNVSEWVWDWSGEYPKGPVSDPTGPAEGSYKVFRGGGFYQVAKFARSADRAQYSPAIQDAALGLRVARTAP